ncbi:MAG: VCBS repeat-containing protein [Saprospiraceae bacterium]|nr:VCBS repeat-containing protein [Saprospiraceae bacterium]
MNKAIFILLLVFFCLSCKDQPEKGTYELKTKAVFELLDVAQTGIDFNNVLNPTNERNIFSYMYYYNGGGVATADLNNDGLDDVVFTANEGESKLYLNKGKISISRYQ